MTSLKNGPEYVEGVIRKALSFDGVDDYVDCGDDFTSISTEFTIMFWMKTSDTTKDGTPISYATTHSDNEILLYNYKNFGLHVGGSAVGTGVSANDGKWHHIVWTWKSSGGETKLYKDGSLVYSGTLQSGYTINHGTDRRLIVGQEQDSVGGGFDSHQAFNGIIDEVLIYNRALTEQEIKQLFCIGAYRLEQKGEFDMPDWCKGYLKEIQEDVAVKISEEEQAKVWFA